ncbi:SPOSA6832_04649 [Sporobolomyces salmonicolor]|uniref:SPOSA6832_04649-mRNA-1:cds n=1 Tax=Sporidiobolus salmonicolor TaxID=5005 RepID=A0A0D6ESN8_SPOSA|nr:SPOSA6832_04649 [Sporobolomyces salmonicolor]
MPSLSNSAIPAFLARLSSQLPSTLPSSVHFLVPLLTATTLGQGPGWLPPTLSHAFRSLPPSPAPAPPEPFDPAEDASVHPRRFAVRQAKEALVKSSILVGVPKVIETLLELQSCVDEGDRSAAFVRKALDPASSASRAAGETTFAARARAGRLGLGSIYQDNLLPIFDLMRQGGLEDVRFYSECITYGTFLTPHATLPPSSPSPDPFASDARLLSVITLSCLVPQRTHREILWHLRGALRRGLTRGEVEGVQRAIESVCEALGVANVGDGMPRAADIEMQKEEDEERQRP